MNNGYDMQPQSFLASFGETASRSTNMAHLKCCVPIYKNGFRNAPNIHYYKFPNNPDAPCISSSVIITLRGT